MSSGYIYLYLRNDAAPHLAVFEALFERIGLSLENPSTREVLALSADGEQIRTTRDWIASQIAAKRATSVQWWYSDSEDVYCRFNPHTTADRWSIEIGLDGVAPDRTEALITEIMNFFTRRCTHDDATALVVDRTGQFEEIHWHAVVGGDELLRHIPDFLVLPRAVSTPGFELVREEMKGCPQHAILKASLD